MRGIYRKFLGTVCAAMVANVAMGQPPIVRTTIDSTSIFIGQQTRLNVEIAANHEPAVQLPLIADTLMTGVEVLETSKIDTADIGNGRIQLKYNYLITSFDSAVYLLPPLTFVQGQDTTFSEPLALKVSTVPVDTETKNFYDIKGLAKPKFVIWDYAISFIIVLLVAAIAAAVVYFIRAKEPLKPFKKNVPRAPAYVIALQELEKIRTQKLWQQNRIKEYHSALTDVLRNYIFESFNINAMEMTSGEILDAATKRDEIKPQIPVLQQILTLADFVKFAKYAPLPDENELSLSNACRFVNETKPVEVTNDSITPQ